MAVNIQSRSMETETDMGVSASHRHAEVVEFSGPSFHFQPLLLEQARKVIDIIENRLSNSEIREECQSGLSALSALSRTLEWANCVLDPVARGNSIGIRYGVTALSSHIARFVRGLDGQAEGGVSSQQDFFASDNFAFLKQAMLSLDEVMSNVAKRLSKGDASKEEIDLQFDVASGRFDQILRRIAVLDNRSAAN